MTKGRQAVGMPVVSRKPGHDSGARAALRHVATISPISTTTIPAPTSTTKWLAVATTENAIASGPATERKRKTSDVVAVNTTIPSEHVPADVEAGEGCVLVRQPGRLEGAVRARLARDRVDEPEVEEPRRRDR